MDTDTHRCLCCCNGPVKEEEPKMSESVGSCFSFDLNQLPPAEHQQQEAPPGVAVGEAQDSKIRGEGDQSGFTYFNFIYKKLKGLFNILFKKVEVVPKPMFDFDLNDLPPAEDQEATSPNVMEVAIGEAEGSYWLINLINKMLKVLTYSVAAEEKQKEEGSGGLQATSQTTQVLNQRISSVKRSIGTMTKGFTKKAIAALSNWPPY